MIAILFLGVLLFQSSSKLWIFAAFYINQDYIAQNLCENRANPESHCKGGCQLKKQLEKENNTQGSSSQAEKKFSEIFVYYQPTLSSPLSITYIPLINLKVNYPQTQDILSIGYASGIFRPPTTMAI